VNDEDRRKALGDFLKTHRARLSPGSVGILKKGASRRTPGLRREEVAQLAGISVTWYTWLEQGRDIGVSEQVLESIATTLRLGVQERNHVFRLARKQVPPDPSPTTQTVSPALRSVLDNLSVSPAWVIERRWSTLAWNRAAREVFGDFGAGPSGERNILRFVFTDEALRRRLVDWEAFARSMLATFRASCGKHVGESWFLRLVEDLKRGSPEFRRWWPQHDVREAPLERLVLDHPDVGPLELDNVSFQVKSGPELRVCVYAAAPGSQTAEKIERLVSLAGAG
jgi:transcriptional regulator with XRE-family HTH domain